MSEESVKRRLLPIVLFPLLLSAAPAQIVAGAVRDQDGQPLPGAVVIAGNERVVTDADGVFTLERHGSSAVTISCAYCRTTVAPIDADGTVAAVVLRYDAVARSTPSARDVASVPYARGEQLFSLVPFAVLFDTERRFTGPQVSLYAHRPSGLVIDNGVPSYDSAAGASPFIMMPGFDAAAIQVDDVVDAPRYGNFAGGGTFYVQSASRATQPQIFAAGNERGAHAAASAQNVNGAVTAFADATNVARRIDASASGAAGDVTYGGTAFAVSSSFDAAGTVLQSGMSAAYAHVELNRPLRAYADVTADRAGYAAEYIASGRWSDVAMNAGIERRGAIDAFADVGARFTGAFYGYEGTLTQKAERRTDAHAVIGAARAGAGLAWNALLGAYDVEGTRFVTPSVEVRAPLAPQWNVDAAYTQAFDVPPLVAQSTSGYDNGADVSRYALERVDLAYGDLRRLRAGAVALREMRGALGDRSAVGAFVHWQVAPELSLRTWFLTTNGAQHFAPANAWLAYRSPSGLSADAIWRRDILDASQRTHVDESISAPLTGELRAFAASESHGGRRYFTVGVRF